MTSAIPPVAGRAFAAVRERLNREPYVRARGQVASAPAWFEERPYSFVFRATIEPGNTAQDRGLFVKVFKEKAADSGIDMRARVLRDHRLTCTVHDFMEQGDGLMAVRPVACYGDLLATVTEEAGGMNLLHYLERHAKVFPRRAAITEMTETMVAVGQWVRRFQEFERGDASMVMTAMADYVDHRLVKLARAGVIGENRRADVLDYLRRLADSIDQNELREVAVHADFAPGNVLVEPGRVVVIDFAMMSRGSRLLDLTRMHFQLDLLLAKPWFSRSAIEAMQDALLAGFDTALSPGQPLFRFLMVRHRINHLATVALKRERFPARLMNARLRHLHVGWLDRQLSSTSTGDR